MHFTFFWEELQESIGRIVKELVLLHGKYILECNMNKNVFQNAICVHPENKNPYYLLKCHNTWSTTAVFIKHTNDEGIQCPSSFLMSFLKVKKSSTRQHCSLTWMSDCALLLLNSEWYSALFFLNLKLLKDTIAVFSV